MRSMNTLRHRLEKNTMYFGSKKDSFSNSFMELKVSLYDQVVNFVDGVFS